MSEQVDLFGEIHEPEPPRERKVIEPVNRPAAGPSVLLSRAEHCRSCSRPIVWAATTKTVKGVEKSSWMPVDVVAVPGGNVRLTLVGRTLHALVVKKADADGRADLHLSHFKTCPHADDWRKKGRRQ